MINPLVAVCLGVPVVALLISPLLGRSSRESGPILLWHSFGRIRETDQQHTTDRLQALVETVEQVGLRFGTVATAMNDPQVVALTVDDGYADTAAVWPYLRGRGIPLTVFVPTAFIGADNSWDHWFAPKLQHLSARQITELAQDGVDFGSHSDSHTDLTAMTRAEVDRELQESQQILQELTGKSPRYLAYPFGKTNQQVIVAARAAGFSQAFTSVPFGSSSFSRGRTPCNWLDNSVSLKAKLSNNFLCGAENLKSTVLSSFSHLTPLVQRFKR
jgi:peptidoglycan/xylan/chitin deacetylase (PgdA/CDA1 family)